MASLRYSLSVLRKCSRRHSLLSPAEGGIKVLLEGDKFSGGVQSVFAIRRFGSGKKTAKEGKKEGSAGSSATPEIERLNREVKQYKKDSLAVKLPEPNANNYTFRTQTCGELTVKDVGKWVILCGWLTFKRLHGTFLVLRDLYGVTQIYVPKELEAEVKKAEAAPLESVLQVTGRVGYRPQSQRKKDQVSGDIEVVAESVRVLSQPTQLRLAYNDLDKTEEELCVQYRYLYLRSAKVQTILRNRATFITNIRRFMETNQFTDLETPTLIRRTPGGAREFPVLTKFKSSYYALAQSPQVLKQLLMVAGMDKYYQIARCYRDELGKPDRQPEFTQLDIELSFTSREGVMQLVEDLIKYSCPKQILPSDLTEPFPVMSYKQCMERYGTDKPDNGGFLWVVDFPLFLRNEQTGRLEAAHHPFTMPASEKEMYENPEAATGLSYDLVYCGAEVGGGSIRIHDAKLQKFIFKTLELPLADIDFLLDALECGCPPHGGFALGIDRFLHKIFATKSIRDVIAFPKTSEGKDLLSGAPTPLDDEAKKYYNL